MKKFGFIKKKWLQLCFVLCIVFFTQSVLAHGDHEIDPQGVEKFMRSYMLKIMKTAEYNELPKPMQRPTTRVSLNGQEYVIFSNQLVEALIHSLVDANRYLAEKNGQEQTQEEFTEKYKPIKSWLNTLLQSSRETIDLKLPSFAAEFITQRGAIGLGLVLVTWPAYTMVTETAEHVLLGGVPGAGLLCQVFQIIYWSQLDRFLDIFEITYRTQRQVRGGASAYDQLKLMKNTLSLQMKFQSAWASVIWVDLKNSFNIRKVTQGIGNQALNALNYLLPSTQLQLKQWLESRKAAIETEMQKQNKQLAEVSPDLEKHLQVWSKLYQRFIKGKAKENISDAMLAELKSEFDLFFSNQTGRMQKLQLEQITIHVEALQFAIRYIGSGLNELALDHELPREQVIALRQQIGKLNATISEYRAALNATAAIVDANIKNARIQIMRESFLELIRIIQIYTVNYSQMVERAIKNKPSQNAIDVPDRTLLDRLNLLLKSMHGNIVARMERELKQFRAGHHRTVQTASIPNGQHQAQPFNQAKIMSDIEQLQRYARQTDAEKQENIAELKRIVSQLYTKLEPLPLEEKFRYLPMLAQIFEEIQGKFYSTTKSENLHMKATSTAAKFMGAMFLATLADCLDDLGKMDFQPLLHFISHLHVEIAKLGTFAGGAYLGAFTFELSGILKNKIHAQLVAGGAMHLDYTQIKNNYHFLAGYSKPQIQHLVRGFLLNKSAFLAGMITNKLIWEDLPPGISFSQAVTLDLLSFIGAEVIVKGSVISYRIATSGYTGWRTFQASTGMTGLLVMAAELYIWNKLRAPLLEAKQKSNYTGALGRSLLRFGQGIQKRDISFNPWDTSDLCERQNNNQDMFQFCLASATIPMEVQDYLTMLSLIPFYQTTYDAMKNEKELDDEFNSTIPVANWKLLKRNSMVDRNYMQNSEKILNEYHQTIKPVLRNLTVKEISNKINRLQNDVFGGSGFSQYKKCIEEDNKLNCGVQFYQNQQEFIKELGDVLFQSGYHSEHLASILENGRGLQQLNWDSPLSPEQVFMALLQFGSDQLKRNPSWKQHPSFSMFSMAVASMMLKWNSSIDDIEQYNLSRINGADQSVQVIYPQSFHAMQHVQLADLLYETTGLDIYGNHTRASYLGRNNNRPKFLEENFDSQIKAIYQNTFALVFSEKKFAEDTNWVKCEIKRVISRTQNQSMQMCEDTDDVLIEEELPTHEAYHMVHVFIRSNIPSLTPAVYHHKTVYAYTQQ